MATIAQDPKRVNRPRLLPVAQIEFRWPGYDPAAALRDYEPTPYDRIIYTDHVGALPHVTGGDLGAVKAWMDDYGLVLFCAPAMGRTASYKGHWAGVYMLTLGQEVAR